VIIPLRSITREEVVDHYDDLDLFYREVWGEHVHHGLWSSGSESAEEATQQLVRRLAERVGIARHDRVVDIGSGYGATARQLVEEHGTTVTAITLSSAQHAFAMKTRPGSANPHYRLGDWLENDLADASFDCAIAIESTEHMHDKAAAFQHVYRVLVPGGRAGICAWIAADTPRAWMVRHLLEPICREGRLPGMGTESDYRGLLESAGLDIELVEDLSPAVASTWRRSIGRVAVRIARDGRYRSYLTSSRSRNREFAITLLRILAAYRTGAMRYLLFVARRPPA